jgi:hypothetical protein
MAREWSPEHPRWFGQLTWSERHLVASLDKALLPLGAGIYVFTSSKAVPNRANALYVGKADGAMQTLRTRVGSYLSRFRGGKPSTHGGKEDLLDYYFANPSRLFLCWAGCVMATDIEGGLIDSLEPPFNRRGETPGVAFDEKLPAWALYR